MIVRAAIHYGRQQPLRVCPVQIDADIMDGRALAAQCDCHAPLTIDHGFTDRYHKILFAPISLDITNVPNSLSPGARNIEFVFSLGGGNSSCKRCGMITHDLMACMFDVWIAMLRH